MKVRQKKKRRFKNVYDKEKTILSVFQKDEKLTTKQIAERLRKKGFYMKENHLGMFIRYNMLYKYLDKVDINGTRYYFRKY